jgi:hypothetical protein
VASIAHLFCGTVNAYFVLFSPESQPDCSGSDTRWKIGEGTFAMERPGAASGLQAKASHAFEITFPETKTIR